MKPEISNKRKKIIKRNVKRRSPKERARHTDHRAGDIRLPSNESNTEVPVHGQSSPVTERTRSLPTWKIILLTSILFVVTAFAIYSPSLNGEFQFDDNVFQTDSLVHITQLSQLRDLIAAKELGRRIGMISFALNYYWGELNPFGYHLVNIVIHSLNGLLLFLLSVTLLTCYLGERMKRERIVAIAFLGSLLWLVHPLQSQAVSYIVQRLTSLCALFFLLSLFCYLQGRLTRAPRRLIFFTFSFLFGLLAIDTKQNAATLPLFILLAEFLFFQRDSFITNRKRLWILMVGGGIFILIAGMYLGPDFITRIAEGYAKREWTMPERLLTELRVVVFYLGLLIYPHPSRLNLDHDFSVSTSLFAPFTTVLSLAVIIGLLGLSLWMVRRNRLVAYALLWFVGNLVIESSIIPLELVFEHRMYLPSMSIIVLGAGMVVWMLKEDWKWWGMGGLLVVSLIFSYWTYERAFVWRDKISLWQDAVEKSPHKARPHSNLGSAYGKKDMYDEAISECRKALAIDPNHAKAYFNLGLVYEKKDMLEEAIYHYKEAVSKRKGYTKAHYYLGLAYVGTGRVEEAISEYKKAIASNPNDAALHISLGLAYDEKGMVEEAISSYKRGLAIKSTFEKAHNNLGIIYAGKGRFDQAIAEFEKAIALNPAYVKAHNNLGIAYMEKGEMDEAISAFRKAIAIKPPSAESYNNLAWIYATSPDTINRSGEEAIVLSTKACELTGFENPEFVATLAAAYAEKGDFASAIKYQQEALSLAEEEAKPLFLKRLELYQSGQAYRDE